MNPLSPFKGIVEPKERLPEKESSYLKRHVEWLNKGEGVGYGFKRALAWVERIFCDLTIVLIPFVRKAANYGKRFRAEELGKAYLEQIKDKTPPQFSTFMVASDTRAMNHTTYYAINDGVIWYKPIQGDTEWKPMPFTAGTTPIKLSVDGANLCVEDDKHEIHYRKVLKEGRKESNYLYRDKSERNNFKETWFTLPVVSFFLKPFVSARVAVSEVRDWAISHRGQFNHYVEDAIGQKHNVEEGVTTLYTLSKDGKHIQMFDPWKPEWVKVTLPLPETTSSSYEALKLQAAASVLMTIGYETDVKGSSKLKIKTLLADIDTLGWNPGLSYAYEQDGNKRVLGPTSWQDHELPPGAITDQISIVQTGEGNGARELRVVGEGGVYYKGLTEKEWRFQPDDVFKDVKPLQKAKKAAFSSEAIDFQIGAGTLEDFTFDKIYSEIKLGEHTIGVYRKVNIIKKAVGIEGEKYDLVLPKGLSEEEAKKALGVKKLSGLHINEMNLFMKRSDTLPPDVREAIYGEE